MTDAQKDDEDALEEWASGPTNEDRIRTEFDRRERALREEMRNAKASVKLLQDEIAEADRRFDFAMAASAPIDAAKIVAPKRKQNEATAFLIASDWHVGELVDPKTIDGQNEYTPEIACERAAKFFTNGARLIELARNGVRIDTVVLALLGDMITGYIHEELVEANPLSPTEEVLLVQELIVSGIEYILEHVKPKRLVIPCLYGNHGRTTVKRRISTGAKNSFEWMAYHTLAQRLASEKRVDFIVSDGSHLYLDVYDSTIRFHHGDDVRFGGGVGGLSIPLRKACDNWDTFRPADLTVIGHWHQLSDFGFAMVNGSLIGYGPYALSIKARFEHPRQAFFLWDRDHQKTIVAPIRVT